MPDLTEPYLGYNPNAKYHPGMTNEELNLFATQLRKDVINIAMHSGTHSGHLGGELSAADIMAVLYGRILNVKPSDPSWPGRDRMILSKGHNSALQYAALSARGFFSRKVLFSEMNTIDGILQEHCNLLTPGIEAPTGSLGMGLSVGCGMAWAAKYNKATYRTFVILGDGECTEGQIWEAVMFASANKLNNLFAIVDYNQYIITDNINRIIHIEPFVDKWESFGWRVLEADGNNINSLVDNFLNLTSLDSSNTRPSVLIARTIKGYPISFMLKDPVNFHSVHLSEEQFIACMKELS
jgi:transketolase